MGFCTTDPVSLLTLVPHKIQAYLFPDPDEIALPDADKDVADQQGQFWSEHLQKRGKCFFLHGNCIPTYPGAMTSPSA